MRVTKKPPPTARTTGPRLDQSPMAVTSTGAPLINAAHFYGVDDLEALIELLSKGRPVFVGIVLTAAEAEEALGRLDDATAEIAAVIGGARGRGRK
jgi:hypothetical protein